VAAIESGEWDEAESLLEQAVQSSPTDAVSRRHLAEVLWQRGATGEALLQMEAAVQLDPDDATLLVRYGEMLLAIGSQAQALERVDRAVGRDPGLAAAWALRGRVHWQMGNTDQALADLQRALKYSPGAADVLLDLAALHRQRGKHQRCLTTLHHLFDTYSPGEEPQFALFLEGLALADLDRWDDAAASLAVASQRGPANAEILYHLARAEFQAGHPNAATATAQQALVVDASHLPSQQLLAQLTAAAPETASTLR
jgi:tetratricopeptide (TPR) repeat protein